MSNLSGLDIFKYLPAAKKQVQSNCKKCGYSTCMAFALKLAQKKVNIEKCPFVPNELKSSFFEMTKVQQYEIYLKTLYRKVLPIGGETVLFRHEKTFVNSCRVGIALNSDSISDFGRELDMIKDYCIERVGEKFCIDIIFLKSGKDFSRCLNMAVEKGFFVICDTVPYGFKLKEQFKEYVLMQQQDDCDCQSENILVYGDDTLEGLCESSKSILKSYGTRFKENIILGYRTFGKSIYNIVEDLSRIRTLAITHRFEPFVYPVLVHVNNCLDCSKICTIASSVVCRYANILVLDVFDRSLLSAIFTLIHNLYTDPQKPLQVESKVYEINEPDDRSIVVMTTNFALTYFAVANELESIGLKAYLVITPSEGMSVLTAWSADKFTSQMVKNMIDSSQKLSNLRNKTIIIPGLLEHMHKELSVALPNWNVIVGPVEACELPIFLKSLPFVSL